MPMDNMHPQNNNDHNQEDPNETKSCETQRYISMNPTSFSISVSVA